MGVASSDSASRFIVIHLYNGGARGSETGLSRFLLSINANEYILENPIARSGLVSKYDVRQFGFSMRYSIRTKPENNPNAFGLKYHFKSRLCNADLSLHFVFLCRIASKSIPHPVKEEYRPTYCTYKNSEVTNGFLTECLPWQTHLIAIAALIPSSALENKPSMLHSKHCAWLSNFKVTPNVIVCDV